MSPARFDKADADSSCGDLSLCLMSKDVLKSNSVLAFDTYKVRSREKKFRWMTKGRNESEKGLEESLVCKGRRS